MGTSAPVIVEEDIPITKPVEEPRRKDVPVRFVPIREPEKVPVEVG